MLGKILAKLRSSLSGGSAPAPQSAAAPQPPAQDHPARRDFAARGGRGGGSGRPEGGRGRDQGNRPERSSERVGERRDDRAGGPSERGRDERGGAGGGGRGQRRFEDRGPRGSSESGERSRDRGERGPAPAAPEPAPLPPPPPLPEGIENLQTAFTALGLSPALAFGVQEKGYTEPTPIQAQAIPVVLRGGDVIGSAQTGTGKTAAFALPILQRLGRHQRPIRCLVLEPTRELALQVEEAFLHYGKFTDVSTTVIYGGVGYGKQTEALRRGTDIIVATPGRLLDHLEQRNCTLKDIEILVLDEVDRMLDMGFLPDVKRIVGQCPTERQTLFFTATLPPEIERLAAWALREPLRVAIGRTRSAAETVAHAFYPVVEAQKFDLLVELLKRTDFKSVIIFSRTKMGADRVAAYLKTEGHSVGVMHADRSQGERTEALAGFKAGKYEVLVATDIAARGLDIQGVSHVINYDTPENPEDYVHRIGRTGRAMTTGDAFTLVTEDDVRHARSIERFIGAAVEKKKLEGFPYTYSALFDTELQAGPAKAPSRLHRGARR